MGADISNANYATLNDKKLIGQVVLTANDLSAVDLNKVNSPNGVAPLDGNGLLPLANLPSSITSGTVFKGLWNASTNTPTIVAGSGTVGNFYIVSLSGGTNLNGTSSWSVGDWVIFSSGIWNRIPGNMNRNLLSTLPDLTLTALANGQVLRHNMSTNKWYNSNLFINGGSWNASNNTPSLVSSVGTGGTYYTVSVPGKTVLDSISNWNVGDIVIFMGSTWQRIITNHTTPKSLPSLTGVGYDYSEVNNYLTDLSIPSSDNSCYVRSYPSGVTESSVGGYVGSVYSPQLNRIYFVPNVGSTQTSWHYLDCDTNSIVSYPNLVVSTSIVVNAYSGGVYSPTQNRIYLVPYGQGNQATWHYIDCVTNAVVSYNSTTAVANAYSGGVYSPSQNRIYFVPYAQANQTNWHYIDCSNGTPVSYAHGLTTADVTLPVANAYLGGVYNPVDKVIFFIPYAQATQSKWHYISCSNGSVVAYTHGLTNLPQLNAYAGGVYSPTEHRIYLVPYAQANQANWHYIDCYTGTVTSYVNGASALAQAYWGGVYSPTQNRIYFVPYAQSTQSNWHYLDCKTGTVISYITNVSAVTLGYTGGTYSPAEDRVYFSPSGQYAQSSWHFIASMGGKRTTNNFPNLCISSNY